MTQKRPIRISKVKPDSGSISTRSYAFVFSDKIEDWQKSSTKGNLSEYNKRYYQKKKSL